MEDILWILWQPIPVMKGILHLEGLEVIVGCKDGVTHLQHVQVIEIMLNFSLNPFCANCDFSLPAVKSPYQPALAAICVPPSTIGRYLCGT